MYLLLHILVLTSLFVTYCQFAVDSPQYRQKIRVETDNLYYQITHNEDVRYYFDPSSYLINSSIYVVDYPRPQYYHIRILMDPCRLNAYNCCMNVFGAPEYPALLSPGLENERITKPSVIASDIEVSKNYKFISEDFTIIPTSNQRSADDNQIWDDQCISLNNPYTNCSGRNWAYQRSDRRPACMDNNYSLNALSSCHHPNGTIYDRCVQVGYSQNAFIAQCIGNDDNHCGTFLEIHMPRGSPYYAEDSIISDVRIITPNVTGVYTTIIPLSFMNNHSRVLCSYTEQYLRIGTPVYITSSAPTCCCPSPYSSTTRTGSVICPKGAAGSGAYATKYNSINDAITVDPFLLQFPYCPSDLSANDTFHCTIYDNDNQRSYVTSCPLVYQIYSYDAYSHTSDTLFGDAYGGICPYFDVCALSQQDGSCNVKDLTYSFIGRVGIVTKIEAVVDNVEMVWVSFNNGRTSYPFDRRHIKIDTLSKSMYEMWYVLRTPSNFVLHKRKGFNVTSPACTYDTTNSRYFPYAEINAAGESVGSSAG